MVKENSDMKITQEDDDFNYINQKRVKNIDDWKRILKAEKRENNIAIDILKYLYDCNNYISNGKNIAKYFGVDVAAINSYIKSFGKRVIDLLGIDEQYRSDGSRRRWNIPFETVTELNKPNVFTWKLRGELVDALCDFFDLEPKDKTIADKFESFQNDYSFEEYNKNIENNLQARNEFVSKFPINSIKDLTLDEFVIGRKGIDSNGEKSFCYLLEISMRKLGEMRGATSQKFGVWYSKKNKQYEFTKKYEQTLEEAFDNLKREITLLLFNAYNNDLDRVSECEIANLFKGKLLSTYFPEKFIDIYDEEDVDKFLNILNINYDIHEVNTIEKKKRLLLDYQQNTEPFKKYSSNYFMMFLYREFKETLYSKNTVSGEIDYNLDFVELEYLKKHETVQKQGYRSRETDYERISRNKKDVGNRGEKAILKSEIIKLKKLGMDELAEQVSISENDAIGYDILSFDEEGNEIHIEVKTNSSNNSYIDFYISDNELQHLMEEDNYYIYYLYNIKGKPKVHIVNKKSILQNDKDFFKPVIYRVSVDVQEK